MKGRALCRALARVTDEWLVDLFHRAVGGGGATSGTSSGGGLALVATGGHGRGELAPGSDLDLWLVHDGRPDVALVAERLWYPIWDSGLKLGHAVHTPESALALMADDLDTATASLSLRHLAGDVALSGTLGDRARSEWRSRSSKWLVELARRTTERHDAEGEVAFLLEPDLKAGRGGLRDVHALSWMGAARPVLGPDEAEALRAAEDDLLAARVELHRALLASAAPGSRRRLSDQLLLERQDEVAAALGLVDADALMGVVATAARSIAYASDEIWAHEGAARPRRRLLRRDRPIGPGLVEREGEVHVEAAANVAADPTLVLRTAAAAAASRCRIERRSLDRLDEEAPVLDGVWPDEARHVLVSLLAEGHAAIAVLEALDHHRLVERVLPEWSHLRSRPQRNALHRFTVDRHSMETAANAAGLTSTVARPDLLLVAALLHDIGKGRPGDHSEVGADLVGVIVTRMGFGPDDVAVLVTLVRQHLLLPVVATSRDLGDPEVVARVAEAVGDLATLELLAALTEADSRATNQGVWSSWKAGLVAELVERAAASLRGAAHVTSDSGFPDPSVRARMAAGATSVEGRGSVLLVVTPDRPGVFSRVAGTLALRGATVLAAEAIGDDDGMAASEFSVEAGPSGLDWARVTDDVRAALAGRLALEARLAERARTYPLSSAARVLASSPSVRIDNTASATSTVVEVRTTDAAGVLYRITRALADLDLDIRLARVTTLGHEVVDSFYVRNGSGGKVADRDHVRELERAILHQLSQVA